MVGHLIIFHILLINSHVLNEIEPLLIGNFIERCLVVSNIMIVNETIIDPLGDRVGWCR